MFGFSDVPIALESVPDENMFFGFGDVPAGQLQPKQPLQLQPSSQPSVSVPFPVTDQPVGFPEFPEYDSPELRAAMQPKVLDPALFTYAGSDYVTHDIVIEEGKYDFGYDLDYLRETTDEMTVDDDGEDIISRLPYDFASNFAYRDEMAELMHSTPVRDIVLPRVGVTVECSDDDMEAEFNRLQAIDFSEKRKEIEQMLRLRREQEKERQRQIQREQERSRQEALQAQSETATTAPAQPVQIPSVPPPSAVPASVPGAIPSIPPQSQPAAAHSGPQPVMDLIMAPRAVEATYAPAPSIPTRSAILVPSAPPASASVPQLSSIKQHTSGERQIEEMFGFESQPEEMFGFQPQPESGVRHSPEVKDLDKIDPTQDVVDRPTSETWRTRGSIQQQLSRLQGEIKQMEQDSMFAKHDGVRSRRAEARKYLETKTYEDDYDVFRPSRHLQKYYEAKRAKPKPKETIYSPYSEKELSNQRMQVRAELEAQRNKEQRERSYYEKMELKRLTAMYTKLESELNVKTISEELAQEKRKEFDRRFRSAYLHDKGSDICNNTDNDKTIRIQVSDHNVVHLPRSLFFTPDGQYKNYVRYLDYKKVFDRFSHTQVIMFIFVVSSQERKLKCISKTWEDFHVLHRELVSSYGHTALPSLPSFRSMSMGGGRHEVIHETQEQLTKYLIDINNVPAIRTCTVYRNFLRHQDLNFFQGMRRH